jgi:hypothetical protein
LRPSQHGQAAAFANRISEQQTVRPDPYADGCCITVRFSLGLDQVAGAELLADDQHLAPAKIRAYGKPFIKVASSWVNSGGGKLRTSACRADVLWCTLGP